MLHNRCCWMSVFLLVWRVPSSYDAAPSRRLERVCMWASVCALLTLEPGCQTQRPALVEVWADGRFSGRRWGLCLGDSSTLWKDWESSARPITQRNGSRGRKGNKRPRPRRGKKSQPDMGSQKREPMDGLLGSPEDSRSKTYKLEEWGLGVDTELKGPKSRIGSRIWARLNQEWRLSGSYIKGQRATHKRSQVWVLQGP